MSKYMIWKYECATCGWDEVGGEDDNPPEACPDCGATGDWWDEDADDEEEVIRPPKR